ncbi:peptidylprolyl isomerase [Sediminitomix flava]|uniref:Peptidyl-prolyl cis-trans isomerase SurA n=1 Tax=Sediminitomix flava TaxID=379075 RepID=A0A315Z625_SEDFL|nr:peptidylprolyl isomerase [Sediminitomix flava]PWJ39317.1 peptidyl-prolyl cis-trans isomerase SurA [Sediminitomix flava]
MKKSFLYLLFLTALIGCQSLQKNTKSSNIAETISEPLLTVDSLEVSKDEFLYLYDKNYGKEANAYSDESLKEYLDRYQVFKLKVAEAYSRGLDKDPALKQEYEMYQKQLADSYLKGREFSDAIIKEAYERLNNEVEASHILIRVSEDAPEEDTLAAFQKITEIRTRVLNGEDFGTVAQTSSEDPSAKKNKGYLGYFTAFQMVYPFESGAFNTPSGEISEIVRSSFGYHIIKVHSKREVKGKYQMAHILLSVPKQFDEAQKLKVKEKADAIYEKLMAGEDWNTICQQFSQDTRSSRNGGIMPPVRLSSVPKPIAEGVRSLSQEGEITEPVRTQYGWHIVKLIEIQPMPSFEEMEPELKKRMKRDARAEVSQQKYLAQLKLDYDFEVNEKLKASALASFDSTLLEGKWKQVPNKQDKKIVLKVGSERKSLQSFYEFVTTRQNPQKGKNLKRYSSQLWEEFETESVMAYERTQLPNKYPEYRYLLKEYKEGIMLFSIMESEVWGKAAKDTLGMKQYYEGHLDKYMWNERMKAKVYNAGNQRTLEKVEEALELGRFEIIPSEVVQLSYRRNYTNLTSTHKRDLRKVANLLKENSNYQIAFYMPLRSSESAGIATKRLTKTEAYLKTLGIQSDRIVTTTKSEGKAGTLQIVYYDTDLSQLETKLNEENVLALNISEEVIDKSDKRVEQGQLTWGVESQSIYTENNRSILVVAEEILPPSPKKYKEVRGKVMADYQDFLEKQWVEDLRQKYPVTINDSIFQSIALQP